MRNPDRPGCDVKPAVSKFARQLSGQPFRAHFKYAARSQESHIELSEEVDLTEYQRDILRLCPGKSELD
jgi:hypothetical protein